MTTVRVQGIGEVRLALERLGDDLQDMHGPSAAIARAGVSAVRRYAPRRTGALAGSAQASTEPDEAVVTVGRRLRYARFVGYGTQKMAASLFLKQTDAALGVLVTRYVVKGIQSSIEKEGFA